MAWRFSRRPDSDSLRSRMAAEREELRRNLQAARPDEPAGDQPWWMEVLAMAKTQQGVFVVGVSLLVLAAGYRQYGPWEALLGAAVMAAAGLHSLWRAEKRREREEREGEALYELLLPLRDTKRDEYDARN